MSPSVPFSYRGCEMPEPILAGCNDGVNRYLRKVWRIEFPDQTWVRVGTRLQARQYIDRTICKHR